MVACHCPPTQSSGKIVPEFWILCCRGDTLWGWATLRIIRPQEGNPMRLWQHTTIPQVQLVSGNLTPPKQVIFSLMHESLDHQSQGTVSW